MKKAIYLIGNVGSGKDFLLRNSALRNLKEIHNDRLCQLYHSGNRLSDKRILVNCAGDDLAKILETKKLLESTGYETLGIFVHTTNQVSRCRSKILNEVVRSLKYNNANRNIGIFAMEFYESFLIYDNSNSTLTEEVKGWLSELNEEIKMFLEHESPAAVGVSGIQNRGHGERNPSGSPRIDSRTDKLRDGEKVSSSNTGKLSKRSTHVGTHKDPHGSLMTDGVDWKAQNALAAKVHARRIRKNKKHMKDRGLVEAIVKKLSKPQAPPPSQTGGTEADAGSGITPTGDGSLSELFNSGIRHPLFTGQRGQNPQTASTQATPGSVGGYNAGTASIPVNAIDGGTVPISGAQIAAGKKTLKTSAAKPPTQFYNGAAGADGTESGSGTPGGATNEEDDSISGTPYKGDSIAGTMSESARAMRKSYARRLNKNKKKEKGTLHG